MNIGRMLSIAKKNLRSLKHDRRTVAFIIIVPLLIMTIFGYTFGGEIENVSVNIVNLDQGINDTYLSEQIVEEMSKRNTLSIRETQDGADDRAVEESIHQVEKGEIWAVIVFDENFSRDLQLGLTADQTGVDGSQGRIYLYLDRSNPNIGAAVLTEVQRALQTVFLMDFGIEQPVVIAQSAIYGENAEFIDFFAPGVMGLAAMMVTFMLSIISFVQERRNATLDRLVSSPATEGEIVGGYALAFGIVGLLQSCVILVTAVLLFQIQIVGNPLLVLLIIFLLGIGTQGLGFMLSSVAKTEFQAIQFMPLILFPSILLAGVFWPIEAIPEVLRGVSYFIPLTYAVEGCRSVMIRGWEAGDVMPEILILIAFAAAMLMLSTMALKRRG